MSETLTNTRPFRVQKQSGYKVNNISLVKKYIVPIKQEESGYSSNKVKLVINNVFINPSSTDDDNVYFDFEQIRNEFRDVIPMSKTENDMVALETTFSYCGLCAQNAYKTLPKQIFNNSIFTNKDLDIRIYPVDQKPMFVDLEEEYYTSDVHKDTYGKNQELFQN